MIIHAKCNAKYNANMGIQITGTSGHISNLELLHDQVIFPLDPQRIKSLAMGRGDRDAHPPSQFLSSSCSFCAPRLENPGSVHLEKHCFSPMAFNTARDWELE